APSPGPFAARGDGDGPREIPMDKPTIDDVVGQLELLRRERRQILSVGSALLGAGLLMVALGAGLGRRANVVEAEQIVLRDRDGKVRATLATMPDGSPSFALLDDRGRDLIRLHGSTGENATLSLSNKGEPRAALSTNADGTAVLNLFDRQHRGA